MATHANSTSASVDPPRIATASIPHRVRLEDEFLALQALRDRTTTRTYEMLDILKGPALPLSGLRGPVPEFRLEREIAPRPEDLLAILDAGPIGPADLAFMSAQRRKQALTSIETLIDLLDAIDPDPDLEPSFGFLPHGAVADECEPDVDDEDGGDTEPNLGSIGSCGDLWMSQTRWSKGNGEDLEEECEDEGACVQSQPHDPDPDEGSLGSLDRRINQTRWAGETSWDTGDDLELDPADREECHRASPRNGRELKTLTQHPVARRQRIVQTERPEDVARRARQQLDALRDKRRKHVLPKSNLTQVCADVVLWHRGGRHG